MKIEEFKEELNNIGIILDNEKEQKLELYYKLLIEWNKKMNLTRITEKEDVYLKHFYDSLTLYKYVDLNNNYGLCDVGSGAGFPGIVLKIFFPNLDIVLVDSLKKRITFLDKVIEELKLKNITAIHDRMEDFSKKNIEKFDIVVSRAVARTEIITEISISSIKIGGHLFLMKSSCDEEVELTRKIIGNYNAKIKDVEKFYLPIEQSLRTIIDIEKLDVTPSQYPRTVDKIKKTL